MDTKTQFFSRMDREFEDSVDTTMDMLSDSGRAVARMMRSGSDAVDLTESEHDELIRTLQEEDTIAATSAARPIPVPSLPHQHAHHQQQHPPSQASSHGSSGSAFLSSVLNPTASSFNQTQLSHTPPVASSYEVSHFGKRARSGSVSGRLRSASEYLEQRGLLDPHTKGLLKDLIIIGDEELQLAIDAYETGDPSKLEEMISSGALQDRLPSDLDILGDLDLDFLTMEVGDANIEELPAEANEPKYTAHSIPVQPDQSQAPTMVSPPYTDDGIGDLEFAGDLVTDQAEYLQLQPQTYEPTIATSPGNEGTLSEMEQRMRSNSLFSALLNDPRAPRPNKSINSADPHPVTSDSSSQQYGKWMDRSGGSSGAKSSKGTSRAQPKQHRRSSAPSAGRSGIAASLDAERKRQEKQAKKEQREKAKQEKKERKEREKKLEEEAEHVHIPGSGRPRSLSDPNLRATLDSFGLQQVERPDGWVGAYSPQSRRVRIDRFMEKRNHRVWTKTVKYDVRKNFADSRLRVKGRFVKKEDEVLMRELMSLT